MTKSGEESGGSEEYRLFAVPFGQTTNPQTRQAERAKISFSTSMSVNFKN